VTLPAPVGLPGVAALAEARVPLSPGHWARLGDLATLVVAPGETEISRDDQRTMVSVTARLSGRDLGSAMGDIQHRVAKDIPLPPGMAVRYAGQWAEQQQSFKELAIVLLGAVAAVLLVLLFAFRSWKLAGSVLSIALASLAGVFVALHLFGATFNIASFVGAIMVVGIVSENAYFLVAAYLEALARGDAPGDAAESAAHRRARPVLMTTLAGIAALAPLALGQGSGSALLRPLAIAVIGGFAGSAALLLLVLPHWLAASGRPGETAG
jgi:cobalt-zinc-cadmium resistance protein CzcA